MSIIIELIQFNPSITSGNQKWKGADPIFIKIEEFIIIDKLILIKTFLSVKFRDIIIIILKISVIDAIACVIKYLIDDSDDNKFFDLFIKGIIEIKLISRPIHIPIQEYEQIVIKVLNIRVITNNNL